MARWQYAWVRDDAQVAVFFSHAQGPGLMSELMPLVGQSLIAAQSSEWIISLDKRTLNVPYFCGLMGDRGWELVTVQTVFNPAMGVPSSTYYFKRAVGLSGAQDAHPYGPCQQIGQLQAGAIHFLIGNNDIKRQPRARRSLSLRTIAGEATPHTTALARSASPRPPQLQVALYSD